MLADFQSVNYLHLFWISFQPLRFITVLSNLCCNSTIPFFFFKIHKMLSFLHNFNLQCFPSLLNCFGLVWFLSNMKIWSIPASNGISVTEYIKTVLTLFMEFHNCIWNFTKCIETESLPILLVSIFILVHITLLFPCTSEVWLNIHDMTLR